MNPNDATREETLDDLKLGFIQAWESGNHPDVESFARKHPEFAEELISFGVRFALAFSGPEPKEEECDDFDSSGAMRRALDNKGSAPRALDAREIEPLPEGPTLGEHLRVKGARVDQLANAINLPTGLVYMVVQGVIEPPPPKLIRRVARYCELEDVVALTMLNRQISATQGSYLQRSKSGGSIAREKMTFGQAMQKCKTSGELTPEQEADWAEEMIS